MKVGNPYLSPGTFFGPQHPIQHAEYAATVSIR
jgi:hypothetical protein